MYRRVGSIKRWQVERCNLFLGSGVVWSSLEAGGGDAMQLKSLLLYHWQVFKLIDCIHGRGNGEVQKNERLEVDSA